MRVLMMQRDLAQHINWQQRVHEQTYTHEQINIQTKTNKQKQNPSRPLKPKFVYQVAHFFNPWNCRLIFHQIST